MSRGAKVCDGKRFSRFEQTAAPFTTAILLKASSCRSVPKKDKLSESKACFLFPIDPSAPAICSAFDRLDGATGRQLPVFENT
jgi:hypothetical protein